MLTVDGALNIKTRESCKIKSLVRPQLKCRNPSGNQKNVTTIEKEHRANRIMSRIWERVMCRDSEVDIVRVRNRDTQNRGFIRAGTDSSAGGTIRSYKFK